MKRFLGLLFLVLVIILLFFLWQQRKQPAPVIDIDPNLGDKSESVGNTGTQADKPEEKKPEPITRKRTFFDDLSDAAIERTMHNVVYDPKYFTIKYPMGDVPKNIGVCTDVVIRSYRKFGVDLQQLVHEDMSQNFNKYPAKKIWGSKKPDSNIDHRRVYNLQAFFERFGEVLPITEDAKDYKPGDLVTWQITPKFPHIGIVVDVGTNDPDRYMVSHNIGEGPKIDDILFAFPITGHYRYSKEMAIKTAQKF